MAERSTTPVAVIEHTLTIVDVAAVLSAAGMSDEDVAALRARLLPAR